MLEEFTSTVCVALKKRIFPLKNCSHSRKSIYIIHPSRFLQGYVLKAWPWHFQTQPIKVRVCKSDVYGFVNKCHLDIETALSHYYCQWPKTMKIFMSYTKMLPKDRQEIIYYDPNVKSKFCCPDTKKGIVNRAKCWTKYADRPWQEVGLLFFYHNNGNCAKMSESKYQLDLVEYIHIFHDHCAQFTEKRQNTISKIKFT